MATAKLQSPASGSVLVDPKSAISIIVEEDNGKIEPSQLNIQVDRAPAVVSGRVVAPFIEVDRYSTDTVLILSFRQNESLPRRDVVISGNYGTNTRLVEQRIFVHGAVENLRVHVDDDSVWCRSPGGVCSTKKGRPFYDGIVVHEDGEVTSDRCNWFIPPKFLQEHMDIRLTDNGFVAVTSGKSGTWIFNGRKWHLWKIHAIKVKISHDTAHLVLSNSATAHIPMSYEPMPGEREIMDGWKFQHEGAWKIILGDHAHIWWNEEKMIVRRDIDPMNMCSDDILWTTKDMFQADRRVKNFTSVIESGDEHAIINQRIRINTHSPDTILLPVGSL